MRQSLWVLFAMEYEFKKKHLIGLIALCLGMACYLHISKNNRLFNDVEVREQKKEANNKEDLYLLKRDIRNATQDDYTKKVIRELKPPGLFIKHVHFIPFEPVQYLHFAVVREPLKRFVSKFYYNRRNKIFSRRQYRMFYSICEPQSIANQSFDTWYNKTLTTCIFDENDGECNKKDGDTAENQLAYFCGQGHECVEHNSRFALEKAKINAEKYFTMVGILEEFKLTLKLMEATMPRHMKGIEEVYEQEVVFRNRGKHKDTETLTQEAEEKLKEILKLDYEFYHFAKQKFYQDLKKFGISLAK